MRIGRIIGWIKSKQLGKKRDGQLVLEHENVVYIKFLFISILKYAPYCWIHPLIRSIRKVSIISICTHKLEEEAAIEKHDLEKGLGVVSPPLMESIVGVH